MEKSENASIVRPPLRDQNTSIQLGDMPFSGLGFDLGQVQATTIHLRIVARAEQAVEPIPRTTMRPAGRWLQLRLGREIRGR